MATQTRDELRTKSSIGIRSVELGAKRQGSEKASALLTLLCKKPQR